MVTRDQCDVMRYNPNSSGWDCPACIAVNFPEESEAAPGWKACPYHAGEASGVRLLVRGLALWNGEFSDEGMDPLDLARLERSGKLEGFRRRRFGGAG